MSLAYPAWAAAVCPSCAGFRKAGDNLLIERDMSAAQAQEAIQTIGAARDRVRQFYRGIVSTPEIFVCGDDACYRRIGGGGSKGMALLGVALSCRPAAPPSPSPHTSCPTSRCTAALAVQDLSS